MIYSSDSNTFTLCATIEGVDREGGGKGGERRQTERDRQTETDTQRETETDTQRETHRETQRDIQTDRQTDRDRQTETETKRESISDQFRLHHVYIVFLKVPPGCYSYAHC